MRAERDEGVRTAWRLCGHLEALRLPASPPKAQHGGLSTPRGPASAAHESTPTVRTPGHGGELSLELLENRLASAVPLVGGGDARSPRANEEPWKRIEGDGK